MIAQKISFAFFNNIIMNILGFVSLFFVARYMGPEAMGMISFALAYIGTFQFLSGLGFGSAHIKRVSEGKDLGKCNGLYFSVRLILILIMVFVVLSTVLLPKLVQHKNFISEKHEIVLYVLLISTFLSEISMMFNITFGARKETAKQSIPFLIGKMVSVLGKVIVAVMGLGVVLLAGTHLVSSIVILLCFLYLFRGYPIRKPDKEYFMSYLRFAVPVMFIGFLSQVAQNIDKIMIQFFCTTADVGFYSASQRISLVLAFLTIASTTLIFPTISSYHSRNDIKAIRDLSNKAERYLSMILFPAVVFIFVFSAQICNIFLGPEFALSAPLLIILSLVVLVNGTTEPYTQQIGGTNRIKLAAKLSAVVFTLDIVLNFVFVPSSFLGLTLFGLGAVGAALSTLISMTFGAVLFRFYAYKVTHSKPNPRVLVHLLSSFVMGLVLYFISAAIPTIPLYYLVLLGTIGVAIYLLTLVVFREFRKKDVDLFLKILNPIQLKKYAASEIKSGFAQRMSDK